ncbi:MAG: OmpA family protein, partial [Geminicoccaceae bacterium]|nr:OmpA family protein [Geminicoccaceae bacterium]
LHAQLMGGEAELETTRQILEGETRFLQEAIARLQQELAAATAAREEATARGEALARDLQTSRAEAERRLTELRAEADRQLAEARSEAERARAEAAQKLAEAERQLTDARAAAARDAAERDRRLAELESRLVRAEEALAERTRERDSLAQRAQLFAHELKDLRETLQAERLAREERLAELHAQLMGGEAELETTRQILEGETRFLQEAIARLQRELATATAAQAEAAARAEALARELEAARAEAERQRAELRVALEQQSAAAAQELASLRSEVERLAKARAEAEQQLSTLAADAERRVATLQAERREAESRAAALEARLLVAERERSRLEAELAETRAALGDAVDRLRRLELDALKLESRPTGPLAATPREDGAVGRILLEGVVPFGLGRADLGPLGERALARLLSELRAALESRADAAWWIEVEGRTDARPVARANFESNESLAAARATAVADRLVAQGVPRERLRLLSRPGDRPGGGDERAVVIRLVER